MMEIYTFSIYDDACSGGQMDVFIHFTICFVHLLGAHDGNMYILHIQWRILGRAHGRFYSFYNMFCSFARGA